MICACITEEEADAVIKASNALDADLVEIRLDYIKDHDMRLFSRIDKPTIATNRHQLQGGQCISTEFERINRLVMAIENGCDYVDIEHSAQKDDIIRCARNNNCRVIISYHDFHKTPDPDTLYRIMTEQKAAGADIGKIAVIPKNILDCHNILELMIKARQENFPLIAFGMGQIGKFTRIASLKYGAPFMYASTEKAIAPGQMDISQMKSILEVLR